MLTNERTTGPLLTDRQREVVRAILTYAIEHGQYPTIKTLQRLLCISSSNGVVEHLKALRKKGVLAWNSRESRSLRLAGMRLVPEFADDENGRRLVEIAGLSASETIVRTVTGGVFNGDGGQER